ncbi:uncharacterized protein [Rutidosis leptorrhynchoides]|uniref:uncharacterized protein n=1 Tax=Rutidosis leptorrhynchoides TaxID=125765 RepID=UPI003A994130
MSISEENVQQEPVDVLENEEDASSSTTGKKRSRVWDYFVKLPLGDEGVQKVRCNNCSTLIKTEFRTSNMKRHIPKCFINDQSAPPQNRIRLDQTVYREKLVISIIKHGYPFSYVENEATRDLHMFLHPDTKPITRNTTKRDVLKIF